MINKCEKKVFSENENVGNEKLLENVFNQENNGM
jgi:hypothetical protein